MPPRCPCESIPLKIRGSPADEVTFRFPAVNGPTYFTTPYTIWDFTPASYGCPHEMERVGRMGDGGKWVCGMSRYVNMPPERPCIIYSFGVQNESSFGEMIPTHAAKPPTDQKQRRRC